MRSEWKQVSVKDVCSIKYGKDHKALENGSIPAYGSGGIMRYVSEALYDRPSVLIPRKGTLDNLFFVHEPFWTIDTLFWTVIESEIIDPRFLYYSLLTKNLANKNVGTAVPSLTIKVLNEISLLLPPLPTQEAIAATLSCLDAKIEVNNKINEKLEQQAQAIFKSWFVYFEPFQDGDCEESELGLIPKGWEVKSVSEISVDIVTGKTPRTKDKENYGDYMMFITIPDMHGNVFVTQTGRYLSRAGVATQPKKTLPPNSIVVSCIATAGLVSLTSDYSHTNQQINAIIPQEGVSSYFIYLYMRTLSTHIKDLGAGGTATVNLNKGQFSKIRLLLPSQSIMKKFHVLICPLFEAIKKNQYQNSTLSALRDTLLPKLMSGEIVVPIADQ